MVETLRDLGVVVDHPAPNVYEVAVGRRRLAVRAARGGGQDARQLHPPRAAAGALRAGHHQQPRRRPDRPAAGRPPRRRDARAGRRDRLPQRLLLRARRPAACAAARSRFPLVSVMGTENAMLAATLAEGHTTIRPAAQEPEVDDLIAFLQADGRRGRADRARHDRGRGPQAPARRRAPGHPRPHRGRHVRRRGGRDRRPGHPRAAPRATTSARSSTSLERVGVGVAVRRRTPIEVDGTALRDGGYPRARHRDRAVPGPRHRPPAADVRPAHPGDRARRTSTRRSSRTASSGSPSCAGWAPRSRSSTATTPPITGPAPLARRRGRDRRPARRRLADPGRPGRRGHDHHPRRAPRSPGL